MNLTTLTNLAGNGDAIAQNELGMAYGLGRRVRKASAEEAFKWFRKSAEQGYAPAQYNLGSLYYHGTGVPKDYQEALKWYRKAADQGFIQAQYFLGWIFSTGRGVEENFKESIHWFGKAADQGDPEAQLSLGLMFSRGEDLNPDYVEAYKWINLSAAQGNTNAVKHRGKLSVSMTQEQIAEGQRRAVQFSEKKAGIPGSTNQPAATPPRSAAN
ncbi:MAG: sel1 repeat family protein [Verrucomicrobia bacterium]|nr:sel1 repeat family protein [Verrucomicrobiota bacterium]